MWIKADLQQTTGMIKEWNRLHSALLEIKDISGDLISTQQTNELKEKIQLIHNKCSEALENNPRHYAENRKVALKVEKILKENFNIE